MNAPTVVANLATQINQEHELAHRAAETAVQHAVKCGELLLSVKASLPHGEFMPWIEQNCRFEQSTASRYMKAANQIATGVGISSIRGIFPSGNVKIKKTDTPVREIKDHDHVVVEDRDDAGHGDGVQQVIGRAERNDAEDEPWTMQERSEIAALLRAWAKTSLRMRGVFVSVTHNNLIEASEARAFIEARLSGKVAA